MNDMASTRSALYRVKIGSLVWGGRMGSKGCKGGEGWCCRMGLIEVDLKAPIDTAFIDQFGQEECVGSILLSLSYPLFLAF